MTEHRPHPTRAFRIPVGTDVFVRNVNADACPLGPVEAEVLRRIDGRSELVDIAKLLNLSVAETAMIASRLVELGATRQREEGDGYWEEPDRAAATLPPPSEPPKR